MYELVAVVVAYRPAREIQLDVGAVVVAENQMAFAVRLLGLERRIVRHVQCQIGPGRVGPLVVAGDLENRVAAQVDNTRAGRAGTGVLDHRCARNYCACLVLHRERDMRAVMGAEVEPSRMVEETVSFDKDVGCAAIVADIDVLHGIPLAVSSD